MITNRTLVGVLSIQGLPPRHGAFEQCIDQLVRQAALQRPELFFYVGCSKDSCTEVYNQHNVRRIFSRRFDGVGVVAYGLVSFAKMYAKGVRRFLVMGYGIAPFFCLFQLLGCEIVCNVDGIEWRRSKWGPLAKLYFKLCEKAAVKSKASLIYDSLGIARYYSIIHRRPGTVMFYGSEPLADCSEPSNLVDSQFYSVVMRMEPENHIFEIVKGFLASDSDKALILIGPTTTFFEQKVLPMIEADPSGRVRWLGPIYDRQKLAALRIASEAYIHGHSVGGTNPTLVEACYIGRPVIAFDSIFNREVLDDNALYFRTAEDLRKIVNLGHLPEIPKPPVLDKRYTWESVAHDYLKQI